MKYKNFQEAYYGMIGTLLEEGKEVTVRGLDMLEIIPGYFEVENPRDRLLNIDSRNKATGKYIFGELLWYLTGNDRVDYISKYSKMWDKLSDNGINSNSAYGKYIFNKMPVKGFGVTYDGNEEMEYKSQWDNVKEVLWKDQLSRQAVIQIKPIQMYDTKDIVCTYFLQFFIRDGKLDMIASMRSNDIMFGLTYDFFMFTFMQELMAAELGVEVGTYKHFASNFHLYKKDMEKINKILAEDPDKETFIMNKIPADFRKKDLPILIKIEQDYRDNGTAKKEDYEALSPLGKDIVNLLSDINIPDIDIIE